MKKIMSMVPYQARNIFEAAATYHYTLSLSLEQRESGVHGQTGRILDRVTHTIDS